MDDFISWKLFEILDQATSQNEYAGNAHPNQSNSIFIEKQTSYVQRIT